MNESIYEEMNECASIFCASSTMRPPQCVLLNASSSMRRPQSVLLYASSSIRPPQCVLLNASSSMRPPQCVLLDATSSMRPPQCVLLNASSFMSVLSVSSHYECNKVCSQECVLNLSSLLMHHNQYI